MMCCADHTHKTARLSTTIRALIGASIKVVSHSQDARGYQIEYNDVLIGVLIGVLKEDCYSIHTPRVPEATSILSWSAAARTLRTSSSLAVASDCRDRI